MATVPELILEQATLMNSIKKTIESFDGIDDAIKSIGVVDRRLQLLEEYWSSCRRIHNEIKTQSTKEDVKKFKYYTDNQFDTAEENYLQALDHLINYKDQHFSDVKPNVSQTVSNDIKLAKIEIQPFTGTYSDWPCFRDLFLSLVDKNSHYSDVQKLYYLKSKVQGEALNLIKNIQLTDANYKSAWKTLSDCYDKNRIMISELLDTIMDIPGLTQESGKDLRTLYNTYQSAIDSLSNLDCPVNYWDYLLVHIFVKKLDKQTRKAWEFSLDSQKEYPSFQTLRKFIIDRIDALETFSLHTEKQKLASGNNPKTTRTHMTTSNNNNNKSLKCVLCNDNHNLAYCLKFKELSLEQRFDLIKKHKHCFNCLKFGHVPKDCHNKHTCFKCNKKHHTLLHDDKFQSQKYKKESVKSNTEANSSDASNESNTSHDTDKNSKVNCHLTSRKVLPSRSATFMGTVKVLIRSSNGRTKMVRAMIDQCSERSIITESLAQQLRLSRRRVETVLEGVGGNYLTTSKSEVFVKIESRFNSTAQVELNALVCQEISNHRPPKLDSQSFESWTHLQNINLSDPDPCSQDKIELILGADVFVDIILSGLKKGPKGTPAAQETIFGWILVGSVTISSNSTPKTISVMHCCAIDKLNTTIAQFLEYENIPQKTPLTIDEQKCETHFAETHSRDDSGQYCVRYAFKNGPPINIGATFERAKSQFLSVENRLAKNPPVKIRWCDFLIEYQDLDHLEDIPEEESHPTVIDNQHVYIPHHYIMRESSTTPLRVVFNASDPSSNGTSLNQHLLPGPKLQIELPIIILRWRLYRIVFTADVTKMYRQIRIDRRDTDYQRVIFRLDPNQPLSQKRLLTVTYGTSSAPYLALKVMQQLANDEKTRFPIGSKILIENFYIDDAAFGADNPKLAVEAKNQLIGILKAGGFELNKWISNDPTLVDQNETVNKVFTPTDETKSIKLLGIIWDPKQDSLNIKINLTIDKNPTKKALLSTIARLYDPMGFLNPVTTRAKIMMQKLWLMGLDWNDPLPIEFEQKWVDYCKDLITLKNVSIPRWTQMSSESDNAQIHGFADASQDAYAAVVYLVVTNNDKINVSLLLAKSRVTPLKSNTLPIPKLELSAAALLSRALQYVQNAIHMESAPIFAWSDSTIVLSWLKKPPSRAEIFVNNRIGEIFSRIPNANWNYVNTLDNPVDCASRGISPSELKNHPLW